MHLDWAATGQQRMHDARCTCMHMHMPKTMGFFRMSKVSKFFAVAIRTKLAIREEKKILRFLFTLNLIFVYHDS